MRDMVGEGMIRWLTVAQTAERLSMSASGLRKQISRGLIPVARLGRTLRVDWLALERRLEREIVEIEDASLSSGRR